MIKLRKSWLICGTICTLIVLALVGAVTYGSPNLAVLARASAPGVRIAANPQLQASNSGYVQASNRPNLPAQGDVSGNVQIDHSAYPIPQVSDNDSDIDQGSNPTPDTSSYEIDHGPNPPPEGSDTGNYDINHGPNPPPEGSDTGNDQIDHGPNPPPEGCGDTGN